MVNRFSSISIKARELPKAKAIENYVTLFFSLLFQSFREEMVHSSLGHFF